MSDAVKKAKARSGLQSGNKTTRCFISEPYRILASAKITYRSIYKPVDENEELVKVPPRMKQLIRLTRLQKSIKALWPKASIIEISKKSNKILGKMCSVDNLKLDGHSFLSVIEASKLYEDGMMIDDLLDKSPSEIKKLEEKALEKPIEKRRNRNDKLIEQIGYKYKDEVFPLYPTTYFYDYMYIHALDDLNKKLIKDHERKLMASDYDDKEDKSIRSLHALLKYDTFTDINYSLAKEKAPQHMEWQHLEYDVANQARAVCIYRTLLDNKLLDRALSSKEEYYNIVYKLDFLNNEE